MKALKTFTFSLLSLFCLNIVSCNDSGSKAVDQYIETLDRATEKVEEINNFSELLNYKEIISSEEVEKIISQNPDYLLSDSDKERIKKSYDKLLKTAYEKTIQYSGLPEAYQKEANTKIEMLIHKANYGIDNAETLGELLRVH